MLTLTIITLASPLLFSVITVCRNNLGGLKKSGGSLEAQKFQDFEWIVIDGASDDGSVEWLSASKAIWISEADKGVYDAMNKGVKRACGDYLLFLNSGDQLANTETLKKLALLLEKNELPDFIYGDSYELGAGGNLLYKRARSYAGIAQGMFTHHQAMLYRRELTGMLEYDISYEIAADYKFTALFLAALAHRSILYAPFPLCTFQAGGISQSAIRQGRRELFLIRKELGTCSLVNNYLIYLTQTVNMAIRRFAPGLYWRIKGHGQTR